MLIRVRVSVQRLAVVCVQPVVHAEVRVLSAGVSGRPAAPARARSVPRSRHLLEARRQQLQQSGLEDSLRSRSGRTRPHLAAHLISAVGLSAALRPRCDLELESDVLCVCSHITNTTCADKED